MARTKQGAELDAENLELVVEADAYPVRLRGAPLDLVDGPARLVRQNGLHFGQPHVPDERALVVACAA